MHPTRIAVVASLLLSWLILAAAMANSSMGFSEFGRLGMTEWLKVVPLYAIVLFVCSWPWIRAFILANRKIQRLRTDAFSAAAVCLCATFYVPISTAPTEGIGWYLIICLVFIWLAYPLSRTLSGSSA